MELTGEPPPLHVLRSVEKGSAAAATFLPTSSNNLTVGSGMSDWAIHALCCAYGRVGRRNGGDGDASATTYTVDGLRDDLSSPSSVASLDASCSDSEIVAPAGLSGPALLAACRLPVSALLESAKASHLARTLPDLVAAGHHILLFSCWTTTLDILEALLNWLNIAWLRLDGSTPVADRQRLINLFNGGGAPVFLV
jgi:SNF2 family DNA or RNA helicase